jgi:uncharacterized protein
MNPAPPLRTIADIERLLEAHADLHALLLHDQREIDVSRLNDVDVIFFDPGDTRRERESDLEDRLREAAPGAIWSVKNQARMHRRNGDAPYRDTFEAVAHWAETATAIAARSRRGKIDVMAPHGVKDLLNLIVRPTGFRTEDGGLLRTCSNQGLAGSLAETDDAHDVGRG